MTDDPPLDFDAFRAHLAAELEIDLAAHGPDARLADDVELDSLQRLEALVAVEQLGVHLSDDSVEAQQTLGGLHERYLAGVRAA